MREAEDPIARFNRKHQPAAGGCFEWTGYVFPNRYGQFHLDGRRLPAHRAAWILFRGPIPEGMLVCHHCDNRKCVNIEHLFLGTYQDNADDMVQKGRWTPRIPNRGTKVNTAKLTETDVRRMRAMRASGARLADVSKAFGIGVSTVQKICTGKYWKHVA